MDFGEEANAFIEAVVIVGRFRILITTFVSLLLWDYVTTLSAEVRWLSSDFKAALTAHSDGTSGPLRSQSQKSPFSSIELGQSWFSRL